MKRITLIFTAISLFVFASLINAQPWMNQFDLDKENPNFFQVQQAFNEYWEGKTPQKGEGYKQFKRWEWFMEGRVHEDGYIDRLDMWNGWLEKQQLFPDDELDEANWTSMGPNLTREYYVGGLGRLNSINFHPTDENTFWVGAASGGLWKTEDHGENWVCQTNDLPVLGVTALAVDPDDTDILYLATGDNDASDTYSIGVLKSLDGGATWETTGLSWEVDEFQIVTKLIMNFNDPSTLIATTHNGIYKTEDGADTWEQVFVGGTFKDLEVDPSDSETWYAARSSTGIYKSTDGGDNWTHLTNGLPNNGNFSRIAIALCESEPDVIHALYSNNSSAFYGWYKTDDGGESWTLQSTEPNLMGWSATGDDNGGQGWYDLTCAVDPNDENTVFAGGVNIWKSTNGGVDWEIAAHWTGQIGAFVHADQHNFEFNNDILYACHDGGINYSTDLGETWTDITDGLVITQIYRLGIYGSGDEVTKSMNGNQDNGSSLYYNGEWTSELGGDGMECAIDPTNHNVMYGEFYFGNMQRTTDGGLNWWDANAGTNDNEGGWVTPFVYDPVDPSVLYKGTNRIYKTENRAEYWTDMTGYLGGGTMRTLAVAPSNHNWVFASNWDGQIYYTTDGWQTWNTDRWMPRPNITYLAFHPEDENILFISSGGYTADQKVYKSENGGIDWINLSDGLPNLPANCILVHPLNPDHLYVGMDVGAYFSPDGGETWEDFSDGLPNVIVNEMELHVPSNTIVAATYGRGQWETPAETAQVDATIRVSYPNGGQRWEGGQSHLITWADNIDENVAIKLYRDDEEIETLALSTPSDGYFRWNVPVGLTPAMGYSIVIESVNDGEVVDGSDGTFEIIMSPPAQQIPTDTFPVRSLPVLFMWEPAAGADSYQLQIATDWEFNDETIVVDETIEDVFIEVDDLDNIMAYRWRIRALSDAGGTSDWSEIWTFFLVLSTPEETYKGIPTDFSIATVYPNPFNSQSKVTIGLAERGRVKVNVYNIEGGHVKTIASGPYPAGYHTLHFDGANLPSGTYVIRAVVPGKMDTQQKVLLLK